MGIRNFFPLSIEKQAYKFRACDTNTGRISTCAYKIKLNKETMKPKPKQEKSLPWTPQRWKASGNRYSFNFSIVSIMLVKLCM